MSLKPVQNFAKHVQDLQSTIGEEVNGFDREFSVKGFSLSLSGSVHRGEDAAAALQH